MIFFLFGRVPAQLVARRLLRESVGMRFLATKVPTMRRTWRVKTQLVVPILLVATSTLFALGLVEIAFSAFLWYPPAVRALPSHVRNVVRRYYLGVDRAVVQGMAACSQYDARVFYTLKPGGCVQKEREFRVQYNVNSQGMRDSELALEAPRMIVIGDSFAMGWGVAQESTFPKRVEAAWGQRVLDAGISSYGTARETSLLAMQDLSALEYVVVQYESNDVAENRSFLENNYRLPIGSREKYQAMVDGTTKRRPYVPGDRVRWLIALLFGRLAPQPLTAQTQGPELSEDSASFAEQAHMFLEVLCHNFAASHPRVKIMAFRLDSYAKNDSRFASELQLQKVSAQFPPNIQELDVEDFSNRLDESYSFDLDDHLRPEGHQVIADVILSRLKSGW